MLIIGASLFSTLRLVAVLCNVPRTRFTSSAFGDLDWLSIEIFDWTSTRPFWTARARETRPITATAPSVTIKSDDMAGLDIEVTLDVVRACWPTELDVEDGDSLG